MAEGLGSVVAGLGEPGGAMEAELRMSGCKTPPNIQVVNLRCRFLTRQEVPGAGGVVGGGAGDRGQRPRLQRRPQGSAMLELPYGYPELV